MGFHHIYISFYSRTPYRTVAYDPSPMILSRVNPWCFNNTFSFSWCRSDLEDLIVLLLGSPKENIFRAYETRSLVFVPLVPCLKWPKTVWWPVWFFSSHSLSMVELRPSSSLSTGCVVSLRGDWPIFCHAGSGRVGRVWSARQKSHEILCHSRELNPDQREDGQWHSFIFPLSYHGLGHGEGRQWDIFILPLRYHDPGHREDRQWDTIILPLSYHDSGHREDRWWDTFILSLSYHVSPLVMEPLLKVKGCSQGQRLCGISGYYDSQFVLVMV